MHERCPEDRAAGESRRDAGDHLDLHLRVLFPQFQDRSRHAVDSCVPTADHRDGSSFFRLRERHLAALDLPLHGRSQELLVRKIRLRELHIDRISHDHIAGIKRFHSPERHRLIFPRSHADHRQFFHVSVPFLNSVEKSGAYSLDSS